jgi:hypothetical protein
VSLKNSIRDALYRTTARLAPSLHSAIVSRRRPEAPVDPRVRYPSYKSLDAFIDVERLKAMDAGVREGVARYLREQETPAFNTGELKLKATAPRNPGSRVIELAMPKGPKESVRYHDLNKPEKWQIGPAAEQFPELMAFIRTLPFAATARIAIMCDLEGRPVTAHRDHYFPDVLHEFIWFRTNFDKPFFVQSWQTKERLMIGSYSAWFDTVNQYHGSDQAGASCISIRVDGRFTDEFRARIPKPPCNAASTPSFWACLEA